MKRAFWPTALAIAFLLVLAASGKGNLITPAFADTGDICDIQDEDGNSVVDDGATMAVDETKIFVAIRESSGPIFIEPESDSVFVDLDDQEGDSDITSLFGDDIPPVDHLEEDFDQFTENVCGDSDADVLKSITKSVKDFIVDGIEDGEVCFVGTTGDPDNIPASGPDATDCQVASPGDGGEPNDHNGFNDNDIDCGYAISNAGGCFIDPAVINAAAEAVAKAIVKNDGVLDCSDLGGVAEAAVIAAGGSEFVSWQFEDYFDDNCEDLADFCPETGPCLVDIGWDEFIEVDVTCEEAGTFDLSFEPFDDFLGMSVQVDCGGEPDKETITAFPPSIEIIPAPGNVSHSLIILELIDEDGDPAMPGSEIFFTADKCAVESSTVATEGSSTDGGIEGAEQIFKTNLNGNNAASAAAVETSVFATTAPDNTRAEDNTISIGVTSSGGTERTVAATILHCDLAHNPTAPTPGVVTVTAVIQKEGSDDVVSVKVTLVGPPASVTVAASPTDLRCGEKSQLVVVIKDAIGQNVSDHTQYEAVTNAGGILGGTGAVIGLAGPVVPVSSTVGETFAGQSTLFLITSEQHTGPYEVVITTGGANLTSTGLLSGLFSTAPISVQTTVRCSLPVIAVAPAPSAAAAPTITAPRTGDLGTTTIRPPATGDAGLADASGASWMLFAIAGAVAFTLVGFATVKVSRR